VLPDFERHQRGSATIWLSRRYAEQPFLDILRDADQLFANPDCQIIKDQKKIKVGRLAVTVAGRRQMLFIKRYNAYALRRRFVSPFVQSGAFRALGGASILNAAEIPSATPVAAVEHRNRLAIVKSFFITEELIGGKTVDTYWQENLSASAGPAIACRRRGFLSQLGKLFRALHDEQIYHNDLKDANILAVPDDHAGGVKLFLLDLEGVKRYGKLVSGRKLKNLVQINRTLGRYLRHPDKLVFLKAYMNQSFRDRNVRRRLVRSVLRESARIDSGKAGNAAAAMIGAANLI
jgi:serine/threonine protein kinase